MKKLIIMAILLSSSSVFSSWFCDNLNFSSGVITFHHENQNLLKDFCETQLIKPTICKVLNFEGEEFFVKEGYEKTVIDFCSEPKDLSSNTRSSKCQFRFVDGDKFLCIEGYNSNYNRKKDSKEEKTFKNTNCSSERKGTFRYVDGNTFLYVEE